MIFSRTGSRLAKDNREEGVVENGRENGVDTGTGYRDEIDLEELDADLVGSGEVDAELNGDWVVFMETGAIIHTNASIRRV